MADVEMKPAGEEEKKEEEKKVEEPTDHFYGKFKLHALNLIFQINANRVSFYDF